MEAEKEKTPAVEEAPQAAAQIEENAADDKPQAKNKRRGKKRLRALARKLVPRKRVVEPTVVLPPSLPDDVLIGRGIQNLASVLADLQKNQKRPSFANRCAEAFNLSRAVLSTLLMLALLSVLMVSLWKEYAKDDAVIIENISMPPQLEQKGYTSGVIANKLADQINHIKKLAGTTKKDESYKLPDSGPDIEVPQANVSLNSIVKYVEGLFAIQKRRVDGEVVALDDHQLRLTLRLSIDDSILYPDHHTDHSLFGFHVFWKDFRSNPTVFVETLDGDLNKLDELLDRASQRVLHYNDPYILAAYLYDKDKQACERELHYCLNQAPQNDNPWAYVLWGNILEDFNDYSGAIAKYQKAIELQKKMNQSADSGGQVFSLAYNNWASVLESMADSLQEKGEALKEKPATEEAGKRYLEEAQNYYEQAKEKYSLASKSDPNYPIAYIGQGDVLKKLGRYCEAFDMYQQTIMLDPQHSWGYDGVGDIYRAWGAYEDAIANYALAVRLQNPLRAANSCRGSMDKTYKLWIAELDAQIASLSDTPKGAGVPKADSPTPANLSYEELRQRGETEREIDRRNMRIAYEYRNWGNLQLEMKKEKEAKEKYQSAIKYVKKLKEQSSMSEDIKADCERLLKELSAKQARSRRT